MNVTKDGFKNRQLHIEDYLLMVSAEQREQAEGFDYRRMLISTLLYPCKIKLFYLKLSYKFKLFKPVSN